MLSKQITSPMPYSRPNDLSPTANSLFSTETLNIDQSLFLKSPAIGGITTKANSQLDYMIFSTPTKKKKHNYEECLKENEITDTFSTKDSCNYKSIPSNQNIATTSPSYFEFASLFSDRPSFKLSPRCSSISLSPFYPIIREEDHQLYECSHKLNFDYLPPLVQKAPDFNIEYKIAGKNSK